MATATMSSRSVADETSEVSSNPEGEEVIFEFTKWAAPHWKMIRELFPVSYDGAFQNRKGGITKDKFIKKVKQLGFRGDVKRIFEVISYDHQKQSCTDTITMRQLMEFQRNYESPEHPGEGMVAAFKQLLHRRYGSYVRAWQVELDTNKKGRVARKELTAACRRVGFNTSHVRTLWNALKQSTDGEGLLALADLDELEALNVESFARIVWDELASLEALWKVMDPGSTRMVTKKQFLTGCQELGFEGDAELLFKGLDVAGVKRLGRNNIDILALWSPSTIAKSWSDEDLVIHFLRWVHTYCGDPGKFFSEINEGEREFIKMEEFVLGIKSHGYPINNESAQRLFALLSNGGEGLGASDLSELNEQLAAQGLTPNVHGSDTSGKIEQARSQFLHIVDAVGWREILELVDIQRDGADVPRIPMSLFMEKFRRFGYKGDKGALAAMLGKGNGDNAWVGRRDILLLRKRLSQVHFTHEDFSHPPATAVVQASEALMAERPGFALSVGDSTPLNSVLSSCSRHYFSQPARQHWRVAKGRKDSWKPPPVSEMLQDRPKWDHSATTTSAQNEVMPATSRQFFGKMRDTPIKDRMVELQRKRRLEQGG